jgi:hypothetical protein
MPRRDDELDDDDRPRRRRPRDDEDDDRSPRPAARKSNTGMILAIVGGVLLLCCGGGGGVVYYLYVKAKKGVEQVKANIDQAAQNINEAAEAENSRQNVMQIGTAIQAHQNALNTFPNNSYDTKNGRLRPLLSWRVHILPYIGEGNLYRQFKLDEPWDSPNNKALLNQMPMVYGTPEMNTRAGPGRTYYRGFSHAGAMFEKPANPGAQAPVLKRTDVTDGLVNTVMVVEAGEAVEWTKPEDLDFGPGRPRPTLGAGRTKVVTFVPALTCDGIAHRMRKDVSDQTLRWLVDRQDGNLIPPGWDQ